CVRVIAANLDSLSAVRCQCRSSPLLTGALLEHFRSNSRRRFFAWRSPLAAPFQKRRLDGLLCRLAARAERFVVLPAQERRANSGPEKRPRRAKTNRDSTAQWRTQC